MAKKIKAVIKLRRATSQQWNDLNPVLREGEPGFSIDENIVKYGDGVTPWKELELPRGDALVVNAETHYEFPNIGNKNKIYKANSEGMLYQWLEDEMRYSPLMQTDILDIEEINGGNAYGRN